MLHGKMSAFPWEFFIRFRAKVTESGRVFSPNWTRSPPSGLKCDNAMGLSSFSTHAADATLLSQWAYVMSLPPTVEKDFLSGGGRRRRRGPCHTRPDSSIFRPCTGLMPPLHQHRPRWRSVHLTNDSIHVINNKNKTATKKISLKMVLHHILNVFMFTTCTKMYIGHLHS